jgi:Secretion system C-terminal sorting domain
MKKFITNTTLILLLAFSAKAQQIGAPNNNCTDLFITELTFGKNPEANNTFDLNYAIEIFNSSNSTVNLSNFTIDLSTPSGVVTSIPLSGTLASHGVYVVGNSNADLNLQSLCDHLSPDLDFELNVSLELKKGNTVIDRLGIGGSSIPQSFDIVQFSADPYNYLLNYHLDLNDYRNIDLRRSMLAQHGNPNFNASTDVIGEWWYTPNVDRSDIGMYKGVCNKPLGEDIIGYNTQTCYLLMNSSSTVDPIDFNVNNVLNGSLFNGNVTVMHTQQPTSTTDICNDATIPNAGLKFDPITTPISITCQGIDYIYSTGGNSGTDVLQTPFSVSGKVCDLILTVSGNILVTVDPAKNFHQVRLNYGTALNKNIKDKFKVYPTNVLSEINVEHSDELAYSIIDLLGNKLKNGKLAKNETKIQIDNFNSGVYFLILNSNNSLSNFKFIKL